MTEKLIPLKFDKNNHLALWKITGHKSEITKNILLTHGTFSNRKVLMGIVSYLVSHGYTCWIFEWRNHGSSTKIQNKFNFETIGQEDFKLVLNYLFNVSNIKNIDCIAHSGGGICLTIALIDELQYQKKINSISLFACQAFGAASSRLNYAKIYLAKYISKIYGYVPAKKVGGEENESYYFMKQWFNWNLKNHFIGDSGINYKQKMKTINIPVLSISGAGDKFIAPYKGCKLYLDTFENSNNQYLYCTKSNGYLENYNHSRIIHSKNARKEIYPSVLGWIIKNSNCVS